MSKLNIGDLLSTLQKKQEVAVPKFLDSVVKDKNKKVHVLTKKQEQMMRRQSNYEMAKQQMDKWVGIVKMNREKESINFVSKDIGNLNVNFFPAQPINDFHKKLQDKLESMNTKSQKTVLKHEDAVLQKVDPQQAKRRLIEARKHRTAIFYQQQKRRRISKIKSKLYHKIKNRQKQRQQQKKLGQMSPGQKNQYIQKLTKQRIKQRITLRHNTKNKHIKNLLRFNKNEKNGIQKSINQINDIRHKELERLNEDVYNQLSEEYDDEHYREQAMEDLQKQIQAIEKEQNVGNNQQQPNQIDEKIKDLKFIQRAKEKRLTKQKQDAIKILSKLQKGKQLKQKDVNSDMQSQHNQSQQDNGDEQQSDNENKAQRKIYGKNVQQNQNENIHNSNSNSQKKNTTMQAQLKNYLLGGNQSRSKNQELIKGINVQNLQSKYQTQRVPIDLTKLIAENKEIYEGEDNQAAIENAREFQQQKMAEIQDQVNQRQGQNKNKNLKGWGRWVGPGIKQKKVDPQQQLRKKLKMIQQIKRKRKDNSLAHVTINQVRNKNLSDYFVRDLPHNYANAQQFDFMQSQPIGPEWNSLNQFKDNIKPKVITKAGQVITPVKLPKKIEKINRKK